MPQFSLKMIFALVAVAAFILLPLGWLARHSMTWGPAERTANMLKELCSDAYDSETAEITNSAVEDLLRLPQYDFLKQNRTDQIELRAGEIAWFSPNSKYAIGVRKDGQILWSINGNRAEDQKFDQGRSVP